jgi:RNA polymerase sigma factor (sigma-70 family)
LNVTSVQPILAESLRPTGTAEADGAIVTELHELHGSALFDFARHLGLPDEDAADAVQEALVRLWRELRRGPTIDAPLAWTYRTCYRLAMQHHRWRRQLSRLLPRLAPRNMDYAGPESSDRVTVWTAVDRLPPRQRHVVYLHYAADLRFEDIARIVGISPSAVRTHASRGLATLRSQISAEEVSG